MKSNRRTFFKSIAASGSALFFSLPGKSMASAEHFAGWPDSLGMLIDLSLCIGCRKCEEACIQTNQLAPLKMPLEDKTIFNEQRRTDAENYTVVNSFPHQKPDKPPVYVKTQCMHCNEPACAAACLVGAFTKSPTGAVLYNKDICLGCRYCMIACPFSIPAYEYFNPTSPRVKKCTLCYDLITQGSKPACTTICPREAITFGNRNTLIKIARAKIANHPNKYIDHIYGVEEAGGTSCLYISEVPFETLGFPTDIGVKPFAEYTRGFLATVPLVFVIWPGLLGGFYLFSKSRQQNNQPNSSNTTKDNSR